jgi:hypothetical protein
VSSAVEDGAPLVCADFDAFHNGSSAPLFNAVMRGNTSAGHPLVTRLR